MLSRPVLLGILCWISCVEALTEFQYLQVLKEFADGFISPRNSEIAREINATLFAEDVKGSIDVSTNFDTRELATEYIFGLFVNVGAHLDEPSILGIPLSYNVTHAVVQHNTVAAGIKINFQYPTLGETYPVEIEAFLNINEQRQITEYDLIFRRWAWATDVIVPRLIPQMAKKLDISSTNETFVLQQYLSNIICDASLASCNGTNEHYESRPDCMAYLNTKAIGQWYRLGEDNLGCRYIHTGMLPFRPQVHCPHVGKSGGEFCVPRNYTQVVLDSHFPQGYLAPKQITPENRKAIQNIYVTNEAPLDPLLEIALNRFDEHSWDPTAFATCTFVFFLVLHLSSRLCFVLFSKLNRTFPLLRHELQINVIMYAMNIFYTTVALALQLASVPVMFGTHRLWMVQCLRTSGAMICSLYCFELVFRHDMRIPLIIHHFLTIFAISFTVSIFEYTQSMTYMVSAIIWLLQATTEQSVFVGLMGYRLNWDKMLDSRILECSAIQTLVFKVGSAIALLVYWGMMQRHSYRAIDTAWGIIVWVIGSGLLATQFWGSYVVYVIGRRVAEGDPTHTPPEQNPQLSPIETLTSPTPWTVRSPFEGLRTPFESRRNPFEAVTGPSPKRYRRGDAGVYQPLLTDPDPPVHGYPTQPGSATQTTLQGDTEQGSGAGGGRPRPKVSVQTARA